MAVQCNHLISLRRFSTSSTHHAPATPLVHGQQQATAKFNKHMQHRLYKRTLSFFFFFLNSSPRRENNKCMVVMWCWNRLQRACNYNSWFSMSPWDKNFCVKDERCLSPLSPNTHVQTERASSGICPVISTAAAEVTVVAHSHLEGTYMLLFDPATLPLWSTIKRCTFAADVAEWLTFTPKQGQSKLTVGSRTRLLEDELWRSSVTPLWKRWRLSTGVGSVGSARLNRTEVLRCVARATVPAASAG